MALSVMAAVARSALEAASGTREHGTASKAQVEALVGALQGRQHFKAQDLPQLGAEIGQCKWALDSEKHHVIEALAAAVQERRAALQNFEHVVNYFAEAHWQALASSVIDFGSKAKMVADHCRRLGLRNPSGPTTAKVVAFALACVEGTTKAQPMGTAYVAQRLLAHEGLAQDAQAGARARSFFESGCERVPGCAPWDVC